MTRTPAAPPALPPLTGPAPAKGEDPAAVYLASLTPGPGRAAMRSTIAGIAKAFGHRPPECPWAALRARHVVAGCGANAGPTSHKAYCRPRYSRRK